MAHIHHHKHMLIKRINRIKGQVNALEHALNTGVDCGVFLHQVASIRGATDGLMFDALEGHIREHLAAVTEHSPQRDQDLEQVISVLKTYLK